MRVKPISFPLELYTSTILPIKKLDSLPQGFRRGLLVSMFEAMWESQKRHKIPWFIQILPPVHSQYLKESQAFAAS